MLLLLYEPFMIFSRFLRFLRFFEPKFSIKIDINNEVFTDAVILPNKVILCKVDHLNVIVPQNLEVICPIVPQQDLYVANIVLGELAF